MISRCIYKVIIFMCLLSLVKGTGNSEKTKIIQQWPSLGKLYGDVWLDNKAFETFNIRPETNPTLVDRIIFTSLGCDFAYAVLLLIRTAEFIAGQCLDGPQSSSMKSAVLCLKNVKTYLNDTYQPLILDMLSTILYYSENWNLILDKNLLKALLATQSFFRNYTIDESPADTPVGDWLKVIGTNRNHVALYIKYTLENYTGGFCGKWSTNDSWYLTNIQNECSNLRDKSSKSYIECLQDKLKTKISDELAAKLNTDVKNSKRELFDPNNYTLSELLDTELIEGAKSSRIKHLKISISKRLNTVEELQQHVINGYHSGNIFKYQSLTIECLSSIAFYLISNINQKLTVSMDSSSGCNKTANETIDKALITMRSLRPVGNVRFTLKEIENKRMLQMKNQGWLFETISDYFGKSNISSEAVAELLEPIVNVRAQSADDIKSEYTKSEPDPFITLLSRLITIIDRVKRFLFTTIDKMNDQPHSFATDNTIQFIGHSWIPGTSSELRKKGTSNMNTKFCKFADHAIKHFTLSDLSVLECDLLLETVTPQLDVCYYKTKQLTKLIKADFIKLFTEIFLLSPWIDEYTTASKQMMDAMYAIIMYLDNDDPYNVINKNTMKQYDSHELQSHMNKRNVINLKKSDLLRSHHTIINRLEHFLLHNCSVASPREQYFNNCQRNLQQRYPEKKEDRDHLIVVNYIGEVMVRNCNTYSISNMFLVVDESASMLKRSVDHELIISLKFFMVENLFKNLSKFKNELSFINNITIFWAGNYESITYIRNIVKSTVYPQTLIAYQMIIIDFINYIALQNVKFILEIIREYKFVPISENNAKALKTSFNSLSSFLLPYCNELFDLVINYILDLNGDQNSEKNIESLITIIDNELIEFKMKSSTSVKFIANKAKYDENLSKIIENLHIYSMNLKKYAKGVYALKTSVFFLTRAYQLF